MSFSYHYLGHLTKGQKFTIRLNQQAHVALVDTVNLRRYTHHHKYHHYGKLQSYPTEKYYIPSSGEWHIVIYTANQVQDIKSKIIF